MVSNYEDSVAVLVVVCIIMHTLSVMVGCYGCTFMYGQDFLNAPSSTLLSTVRVSA